MTTAPAAAPLLVRKEGGLLWLTLNRPEAGNAFTVGMLEALAKAFGDAAKDAEVRAVALTGAGRAFCAGQDLKEHLERRPPFAEHLRKLYNPLVLRMRRLPKPVIAAVNGTAAGAGMSLALACDFRLCGPETKFHTAFTKIGLVPDSGLLHFLSAQLGAARALEYAMTGRPFGAEEAERWGLVNRVVPAEKLQEETVAFAKPLVEGPAVAFGLVKELAQQAVFARDLAAHLDAEALYQQVAGSSRDHAEGIQAFVEKRAPRFTGG